MAPAAPPGAAAQAGEAGDEGSSPSSGQTRAAAPARRRGWLGRLIGRLRRAEGARRAEPEAGSERPEALRSGGGLAALRSLRVSDVAVPRAEIVAVPVEIGLDGLVEVFRRSGYTRLPVYQRTLDHPLGMVHLKDVALRYG
ncbi:MAG: magnesium/cobalt efflux protein, partial [Alphaproteobacteria bacterium]